MEQLPIAKQSFLMNWRRVVRGRGRGMIESYLSPFQTLSCLVIAKEIMASTKNATRQLVHNK